MLGRVVKGARADGFEVIMALENAPMAAIHIPMIAA